MALALDTTIRQLRTMARISHDKLDDELEMFKGSYLSEMEAVGVDKFPDGDELPYSGLRLYIRYMTNYNGEAERYYANYIELRETMRKSSRYHTYKGDGQNESE